MTKHIIFSGGIKELFIILTRIRNFLANNEDYSRVTLLMYTEKMDLAANIIQASNLPVSVITSEDIVLFLEDIIPMSHIERARGFFFKEKKNNKDRQEFLKFCNIFLPSLEVWSRTDTLLKYDPVFPFKLNIPGDSKERPYVVVCPHVFEQDFSGMDTDKILWPSARWSTFTNRLFAYIKSKYDVFVIGVDTEVTTKKEDKSKQNIFSINTIENLTGKLSFKETVSLIYGCDVFIGGHAWTSLVAIWAGKKSHLHLFGDSFLLEPYFPDLPDRMPHVNILYNKDPSIIKTNDAFSSVQKVFGNANVVV